MSKPNMATSGPGDVGVDQHSRNNDRIAIVAESFTSDKRAIHSINRTDVAGQHVYLELTPRDKYYLSCPIYYCVIFFR